MRRQDPFNDGSHFGAGVGGDLKLGIGSNLTLDATVNPDFGQVEVDPAVVNLSDVETFFDERRPFFVEGASIFNFGEGGANDFWGFNWANPSFLYTPADRPSTPGRASRRLRLFGCAAGSNILGAAKLSGKVGNWSLGALNAVTSREHARFPSVSTVGSRRSSRSRITAYIGPRRKCRAGAMVSVSSAP